MFPFPLPSRGSVGKHSPTRRSGIWDVGFAHGKKETRPGFRGAHLRALPVAARASPTKEDRGEPTFSRNGMDKRREGTKINNNKKMANPKVQTRERNTPTNVTVI